jgi:hypothetical protein
MAGMTMRVGSAGVGVGAGMGVAVGVEGGGEGKRVLVGAGLVNVGSETVDGKTGVVGVGVGGKVARRELT